MKAILIDDEQFSIDLLEISLNKIEGIEIIGKFTDPSIALEHLEELDADVAFLDMEMGKTHGIELAETLSSIHPKLEVIFITAHSQFALQAFGVNAIDYLLKPVQLNKLKLSINKLRKRRAEEAEHQSIPWKQEDSIYAQVMGDFRLFGIDRIEIKWRTKKVKELFILLLQHIDTGMHRSQIMLHLWPNSAENRAISLLHTTVYHLRKTIQNNGFDKPVIFKNEYYLLNIRFNSDLAQLNNIVTRPNINDLLMDKVMDLYPGDYLEMDSYHWCLSVREDIKNSVLNYLELYISKWNNTYQENKTVEKCFRKMILLDPYNVKYNSLLLEYYGETKQINKLISIFQGNKERWINDFGLDLPRKHVDIYTRYITQ